MYAPYPRYLPNFGWLRHNDCRNMDFLDVDMVMKAGAELYHIDHELHVSLFRIPDRRLAIIYYALPDFLIGGRQVILIKRGVVARCKRGRAQVVGRPFLVFVQVPPFVKRHGSPRSSRWK